MNWVNMLFLVWAIYNSSRHTDNTKKDILNLGEGLTDGLDDTIIMKEAKHSANITKSRRKICCR